MYKLYRCHRCAKGLDTDIGEPKKLCEYCGHDRFELNRANLGAEEVYRLYKETGIWFTNQNDRTKLDDRIKKISEMPRGRRQDQEEARMLADLREKYEEEAQ